MRKYGVTRRTVKAGPVPSREDSAFSCTKKAKRVSPTPMPGTSSGTEAWGKTASRSMEPGGVATAKVRGRAPSGSPGPSKTKSRAWGTVSSAKHAPFHE
ncbi:hypothetical protein ACLESO_43340 [Pyxidicoccus sp. 3LG]